MSLQKKGGSVVVSEIEFDRNIRCNVFYKMSYLLLEKIFFFRFYRITLVNEILT